MKITALVENTACNENFSSEHGLSLYIETKTQKILFDMGQTNLFSVNAEKLKIDLSAVDIAILSHGHYDHGGGLKHFMSINKHAPVYLSKYSFGKHYNGTQKYIGLDPDLKNNNRIIFNENTTFINDSLALYCCNDKKRNFNMASSGLNILEDGKFKEDIFLHEQYLLIKEKEKRILISGCSHKGILDIQNWFTPDVLVGGFHFSKLDLDETLIDYAKELNQYNTEFYTCHCTGVPQYEFMKTYIQKLHYLSCGQSITL